MAPRIIGSSRCPRRTAHECSHKDEYLGHDRPGYERRGLLDVVERAGFDIASEPAYSPPGPGRVLGLLGAAYTSLTRSPNHPLLDFQSLPRLRLWKAGLAVLWPLYRMALEQYASSVGCLAAGLRHDPDSRPPRHQTWLVSCSDETGETTR
jgi:hypothetical protein